jgi:hypothetical protein
MLRKIRLELARTPEFPDGNPTCGYEMVLPLDKDGQLDAGEWRRHREACTVRRFWHQEKDEHGVLIHTRHRTWAFSYAAGEDDDEPLFRLDSHHLRPAEYVSVTEHDGVTRPFRVVSVTDVAGSVAQAHA